jgi:hypothetical protein
LTWPNANEPSINNSMTKISFFMLLHLPVMFSQLRCTAVRMTGCGCSPLFIRRAFHFFWEQR